MKNKKYVTGLVIAVAGLVLALAPAAQAGVLYTENFIGNTHTENLNATVGWSANNNVLQVGERQAPGVDPSNDWEDTVNTPDGDNWHAAKLVAGASGPLWMDTTEYTVQAIDRVGTQFSADIATSETDGFRWSAQVGGNWYVSDEFGLVDADNGQMTEHAVTAWKAGETLSVETADWYAWNHSGDPDPVGAAVPLPGGDITAFGVYIDNDNNSDAWAVDNFVISNEVAVVPEPSDLAFTWIHLDPVSDRLALQWASRDEVLYDLLYSNDPAATFDPSAWSILTNGVSGTESSTEIFLPDFQGQSWSMVAPWWVFRLREQ